MSDQLQFWTVQLGKKTHVILGDMRTGEVRGVLCGASRIDLVPLSSAWLDEDPTCEACLRLKRPPKAETS